MSLNDLKIINMKMIADSRGVFIKPFHSDRFQEMGIENEFREDFYSISKRHVLRGLHFQIPPMEHSKLVYCSRGSVLDLALDLRVGSTSYGKCFSLELDGNNGKSLFIPKGFAHGFIALTDDATVHYKVSSIHSPSHDSGILWSSIDYDWSAVLGAQKEPIVSERDKKFISLKDFKSPFTFNGGKR